MKLTFTFTDEPHLKGLSKYDIYRSTFEIPNEALQLPDCEARLFSLVETVGQLTLASLHVTCKELAWKHKLVKQGRKPEVNSDYLRNTNDVIVIVFKRFDLSEARSSTNPIKIFAPAPHPFKLQIIQTKAKPSFSNPKWLKNDKLMNDTNLEYFGLINHIRDTVLLLLKTEELKHSKLQWHYLGFHPQWHEDSLRQRRNEQRKTVYLGEEKAKREAKEQAKNAFKPQKGCVYFIQQGLDGAIKIGYSTTPEKRLQSLKTASPYPLYLLKVIEGNKNLEQELHRRFASIHLDGEWFKPEAELLDYINQLNSLDNQ